MAKIGHVIKSRQAAIGYEDFSDSTGLGGSTPNASLWLQNPSTANETAVTGHNWGAYIDHSAFPGYGLAIEDRHGQTTTSCNTVVDGVFPRILSGTHAGLGGVFSYGLDKAVFRWFIAGSNERTAAVLFKTTSSIVVRIRSGLPSSGSVDITSPGFKPDLIITTGNGVADVSGATTPGCSFSFGFVGVRPDGSEFQRGLGFLSRNGLTTSQIAQRTQGATIILWNNAGSVYVATITRITGGFRITRVVGVPPADYELQFLCLSDDDWALDDIGGEYATPTSTGSLAITGRAVNPDHFIGCFSSVIAGSAQSTGSDAGSFSFISARAGSAMSVTGASKDAVTATVTRCSTSNNRMGLQSDIAGAGYLLGAAVTSMNSGGMTLNWTAVDTSARSMFGVLIQNNKRIYGSAGLNVAHIAVSGSSTFANPPYAGSADLSSSAVNTSASATSASPTYTGVSTLVVGNSASNSAVAFSNPTYTSTAVLVSSVADVNSSATFTNPTYTSTATLTSSATDVDASAAFASPTFTAASDLTTAVIDVDAAATFVEPMFTATSGLMTAVINIDTSATFIEPTFTATASLTTSFTIVSADATFAVNAFTATASLATSTVSVDSSATFFEPTFSATAGLVSSTVSIDSSATFVNPVFTATSDFTAAITTIAADAAFAVNTFTATCTSTATSVIVDVVSTTSAPQYSGSSSLLTATSYVVSDAAFSEPIYVGDANLDVASSSVDAAAVFADAVFYGSSELTTGVIDVDALAETAIPQFTSTANFAITGVVVETIASHAAPSYTADAQLTSTTMSVDADGLVSKPTYITDTDLQLSPIAATATSSVINPEYTATSTISCGPVDCLATASFSLLSYFTDCDLAVGEVYVDGVGVGVSGHLIIAGYSVVSGGGAILTNVQRADDICASVFTVSTTAAALRLEAAVSIAHLCATYHVETNRQAPDVMTSTILLEVH